jgi:hypothetical protein
METFALMIDVAKTTVLSGEDAPLHGPIWIDTGNYEFPEAGWYDFLGSVFSSLVEALDRLSRGKRCAESYFFEGSFNLQMEMKQRGWRERFAPPRRDARVSIRMVKDTGESIEERVVTEGALAAIAEEVYRSGLKAFEEMKAKQSLAGPALQIFQKRLDALAETCARLRRRHS